MLELRVGDHVEFAVDRGDYPPERVRQILQDETIAVLGYGVLGRAHALNLRDSGQNIVVGQRRGGPAYDLAVEDGWRPGETLVDTLDATARGSVVQYLLSDAGQAEVWPRLKPLLTAGKALYLAHGFSIAFSRQTRVLPPPEIDVILLAPKGSGTTFRRRYLEGVGTTASYAVHQDATGRALDRCCALGMAFGAHVLLPTTVQRETYADLTGERGVLVGAIQGLWQAQYDVLRERGHGPIEAFFETVEEATQSLYPLIAEHGMDWMLANCSTTAQRGALDWAGKFRDAVKPVFDALYDAVASGAEAARSLEANGRANYRQELAGELRAVAESELWRAGVVVRGLRSSDAENGSA